MKLEYAHTIPAGKSIIEKIQDALDEEMSTGDPNRAEGMALALGILRGSSEEHELELSAKRRYLPGEQLMDRITTKDELQADCANVVVRQCSCGQEWRES